MMMLLNYRIALTHLVHACGICLSDRPLYEDIPLWDNKGAVVTQYEGGDVEAIGIVGWTFWVLNTLIPLKSVRIWFFRIMV